MQRRDEKYRSLATPLLLAIGCCVLVFLNSRYAILNYDDPGLLRKFRELSESRGFFRAAVNFALNADLGAAEYRTYGLSKVFHLLVQAVAGTHAWIYAGLMWGLHFLSAVLLYRILLRLLRHHDAAFFSAAIWACNPFTIPQTFHHWSYLLLPVYLIMVFVLRNLVRSPGAPGGPRGPGGRGWFLYHGVNSLLIVAILFTGEAAIPVFMTVTVLFLADALGDRDWRRARGYVGYLLFAVLLLASHYLAMKALYPDPSLAKRFVFSFVSPKRCLENIAAFLYSASVVARSLVGSSAASLLPGHTATVGAVAAAVCGYLWLLYRQLKPHRPDRRIGWRTAIVAGIVAASTLALYLGVAAFAGKVGFAVRYGYVSFPALLSFLVIAVHPLVGNSCLARTSCFVLLFAFVSLNMLTFMKVARAADSQNRTVVAMLEEARGRGVTSAVLVNTRRPFSARDFRIDAMTPGLLDQNVTTVDSPFRTFWTAASYLEDVLGFQFVAYKVTALGDGRLLLTHGTGAERIVPADKVAVVVSDAVDVIHPVLRGEGARVRSLTWDQFKRGGI